MNTRKENLLNALRAFIRQRSGLEFGNYGDVSAFRSEQRSITKDRHHAETLLAAVAWRDGITADKIIEASKHAFSGRLTIEPRGENGFAISYCTGQYFPTEYRRAVCAVLSAALWDYFRETMPKGVLMHNSETGELLERYQGLRAGDWLRRKASQEFGRTIAARWFN